TADFEVGHHAPLVAATTVTYTEAIPRIGACGFDISIDGVANKTECGILPFGFCWQAIGLLKDAIFHAHRAFGAWSDAGTGIIRHVISIIFRACQLSINVYFCVKCLTRGTSSLIVGMQGLVIHENTLFAQDILIITVGTPLCILVGLF